MRERIGYPIVTSDEHTTVTRDRHASNGNFILRNELVSALVFT
jgi:hypothetical protein